MKERTCLNCGWVHFGVSRAYAEIEVASFNAFYNGADAETKAHYAGPASIAHYEHCFRCGGHWQNFRDAQEGDCPAGCTIQPILYEGES